MSETNNSLDMSKLTNLADAKVLYDDLRGRVEEKADKVANATNGNFAGLDANGNLVDSGKKASDFLTEHQDISGKVDKEAGKGLSTNDYTDEEKLKNANNASAISDLNRAMEQVDDLTKDADVTGDIVTFEDGAEDVPLKLLKIGFDPVQDLHGYDHPWPGGGGKNYIPLTIDRLKAVNTDGTWNGNVFTYKNVVFTINVDADDNVTGINANGQASANSAFLLAISYASTDLKNAITGKTIIYSGCPGNGSSSTYSLYGYRVGENGANARDVGSGTEFIFSGETAGWNLAIAIQSGYNAQNLLFKPMIRLATETDDTFAPYSNICPITGRTGVEVTRTGKNLAKYCPESNFDSSSFDYSSNVADNIYATKNDSSGGKFYATFEADIVEGEEYIFSFATCFTSQLRIYLYKDRIWGTSAGTLLATRDGTTFISYYTGHVIVGLYSNIAVGAVAYTTGFTMRLASDKDDTYEPYAGSVYPITFPSEAGTVYGGELTVNRDGTGDLVVDRKTIIFDGVTSGKKVTNTGSRASSDPYNFYIILHDGYLFGGTARWVTKAEMLAKGMVYSHGPIEDDILQAFIFRAYVGGGGTVLQPRLFFPLDEGIDTIDKCNTWLAEQYANGTPAQYIYPLATHITYTLTTEQVRTLLGLNHIWTNDGDIEQLTYYLNKPINTDVQELREQIVAVQNSIVAPVLSDMIADTALVANDFRIVRGTLYKITSAISSGGTLTPGTNCIATSLGEQLTALLNA